MALVIGEVPSGFWDDGPERAVVIPLPPQNGGSIGWGQVYVSFACDGGDARLRVATWNSQVWRVVEVPVTATGPRVNVPVLDGDQKMCVSRVKASSTDEGCYPVGYLVEATLRAVA